MSTIKRPVIFVRNLSYEELLKLSKNSVDFVNRYFEKCPPNMQIFVYKGGGLNYVFSYKVDTEKEIVCKTYDEFISHWNQYKLWALL